MSPWFLRVTALEAHAEADTPGPLTRHCKAESPPLAKACDPGAERKLSRAAVAAASLALPRAAGQAAKRAAGGDKVSL